jgi:transcription elongation GreA/GreB family factor
VKLHTHHANAISLGSTIYIRDLTSNDREVYTLTRPSEADIRRNRISILSPIGKALYGQESGDIVEVEAPGGVFLVEIEAVEPMPDG